MRIVHVIPHGFIPPVDGGRLKTSTLASALARHGELHLLSLDDDQKRPSKEVQPEKIALPFGGEAVLHRHLERSCRRLLPRSPVGMLLSRPAVVPLEFAAQTPRHGALWSTLYGLEPDLVVADDTRHAAYAAFSQAAHRIAHTHNLESQARLAMGSLKNRKHQQRMANRFERIERHLFPGLSQVWGVKQEDLDAYGAMGTSTSKLHLVPNVVPDGAFLPDPIPGRPGVAMFCGLLSYAPNQEATDQLLDLALALHPANPSFEFRIVGKGAPSELSARMLATPAVKVMGFVEDLAAQYREAAVVIIPLPRGAGTKLKTIEALAAGKPVLTTPIGAEGLGLEDGVHACIRPLGEEFNRSAAAMLAHPEAYQTMSLRGQEHVRNRFSMAAIFSAVDIAMGDLQHPRGPL